MNVLEKVIETEIDLLIYANTLEYTRNKISS
jgi:hypothetical protein